MTEPFTFGMFPFRRPDDFGRIGRLLRLLQGEGPRLPARAYVGWAGARTTKAALDQIAHLAGTGLRWDLVLAYRDPHADIAGWTGFVSPRPPSIHPTA